MRIRATVAAVSGALALSAFVVPAAHAADSASSYRADVAKVLEAAHSVSGRTAFSATTAADDEPYALDVTFSNLKVNSGKAIAVGTTNHVAVPVTYTLTHGADVDITAADFQTGPYIYKGAFSDPDNVLFGVDAAKCTVTSSTAASCKGNIDIYPAEGDLINSDAGAWKAAGLAIALNGQDPSSSSFDITKVGVADEGGFTSPNVQRYSKLTVNASPEPVKKGKTITVTGKLTRANWDTNKYAGYTGQSVKLQFRKKGSTTYTTIKTIKTDGYGNLKTTTTASVDGYYRYSFAGTSTTPAVSAAGDYVDVQ
ncbi:hypothetical protein OG585_20170 [Streptomyces sp. NBC_01340]|uniref:hypothetical protein n=1 Tax=unclassified Streptomyces TaxID=2593676 RepID=UPI0022517E32|nr:MULTISPECIES: hypothetical protein [unclassified Streptomyces]MCX4454966.1 hypothetical protein [Streptomyces sp. NBC_01719]MCX4494326.1 hypothetical protein [Streptomyces sp. NBC_01728]WSI39374.1 hypothetical protein OG585_20170 [Streptomyces sp. NBC_01340]